MNYFCRKVQHQCYLRILITTTGGFQLVDLIITELKDHMICYKIKCSHWWKFIYKKNPLQDSPV